MKIKVEYLGFIKNMLKKRHEEIEMGEGSSLRGLMRELTRMHGPPFKKEVFDPKEKDVKHGFVVTINGVLIGQLQGLETRLRDEDHVILMSLMSGG